MTSSLPVKKESDLDESHVKQATEVKGIMLLSLAITISLIIATATAAATAVSQLSSNKIVNSKGSLKPKGIAAMFAGKQIKNGKTCYISVRQWYQTIMSP